MYIYTGFLFGHFEKNLRPKKTQGPTKLKQIFEKTQANSWKTQESANSEKSKLRHKKINSFFTLVKVILYC